MTQAVCMLWELEDDSHVYQKEMDHSALLL